MRRYQAKAKKLLQYTTFLTLLSLGGYGVYAQVSQEAYSVRSVHVFPASIEAEGWENAKTLTFQNLDEFALLQDFNAINSATLDDEYREQSGRTSASTAATEAQSDQSVVTDENESNPRPDTDSANSTTTVSTPATTDATSTPQDASDTPAQPAATSSAEQSDTDVTNNATSSATTSAIEQDNVSTSTRLTPEAAEATATDESVAPDTDTSTETETSTTSVRREARSLFRLAIDSVTSLLGSSSEEHSAVSESAVTSTPSTNGVTSTDSQSSAESADQPEVNATVTTSTTTTASATSTVQSTSTDDSGTTTTADTITPDSGRNATETSTSTATTSEERDAEEVAANESTAERSDATTTATDETVTRRCQNDCVPYSIELQNFDYPLDEGSLVTGAQLRLSFAAQQRPTRDEVPSMSLRYSVNDGATWRAAGDIEIVDEVSNSINGGYFLFALPDIDADTDLSQLRVQLTYRDDPALISELFVESVWLELFTVAPPSGDVTDNVRSILENNGYTDDMLSGDTLVLPTGERINFDFTDENSGETLIIKSDKKDYVGLTETKTYFSVTNESNRTDEFALQTYFPRGKGEVKSIREYNQNVPKEVVVPEYRPFVYHCEAGWEANGELPASEARAFTEQFTTPNEAELTDIDSIASTTAPAAQTTPEATSSTEQPSQSVQPESPAATTTTATPPLPTTTSSATNTVSTRLPSVAQLLQQSTTTPVDEPVATATATSASVGTTSAEFSTETNEALVSTYRCAGTNIVRVCDEVEGDDTMCRVSDKKVAEHQMTKYVPGWERRNKEAGELPKPGFVRRALEFIGFGPDRKEVPDQFEVRTHTPDTYSIRPGETRYFEMTISFPPFTSGEYWIEAIGDSEYGLLDPFWQSTWRYKKPITIDNTTGATAVEQQVFIELDSSATDFWSNVKNDGGDIRFVREEGGNSDNWYNTSWSQRIPITIDPSNVTDTLTDFPVFVDLSDLDGDFWNGVASDGGDIRLTSGDGTTELARSVVAVDTGSQSGELYFQAPTLSSTSTNTFYLYYNNPSASDYAATSTYGREAVWDNGYVAVYHFTEDPSGSAPQVIDNTASGYDLTTSGMSAGDLVPGQLGDGYDFDGANDFVSNTSVGTGVLDGSTALSVSFWSEADSIGSDIPLLTFQTSSYADGTDDFNILRIDPDGFLSGGSNLYKLGFETANGVANGETVGGISTTNWTHLAYTWSDGTEPVFYQDGGATGYGSGGAPGTITGGLVADILAVGRGNKDEWFDGVIDEFRLHGVAREAAWIEAEHANQATPAAFYATSSAEILDTTSFSELDHWVQHFSTTTQEADIWVQVDELPGGASTTIDLYYGNPDAESMSDEYAPFTYDSPQDLYYVVNADQTSDLVVYSLIDDNEVSIDGGTPVTLQSGETTSFSTYASTSVITANGPLTARSTDNGADNVVPISFASTTLLVPSTRDTEEMYTYAPFVSAFVEMYDGNGGTSVVSGTTAVNGTALYTNNNADATVLESDEPILGYFRNTFNTAGDSVAVYPPTTRDLYGIHSNNYYFTPTQSSTDVDIFCSSGGSGFETGVARGAQAGNSVCSNGANGTGDAVRLANQTSPLAAIQQADSDGRESTIFLPTPEFGTRYIVPQAAEYVSVACSPRLGTSTIEIQDVAGTTLDSGTCGAGGDTAGALNFTPSSPYSAGTQIVSTNDVPFYTYYEEDSNDDETNTWSAVQARKFNSLDHYQFTIGPEEENTDAQYEQQNYRWYENNDALTPVDPWPSELGTVAEGEAISGPAVDPGEELRLRMNLLANNGTGTADSTAFLLQYAAAETCSTVPDESWRDLGDIGSTTAAFAGYNASPNDGDTLPSVVLSNSDVTATYEEENLSTALPNQVDNGSTVEFDWAITPVSGAVTTNAEYCFRMVRSTGLPIVDYVSYPQLLTAGPPETPTLLTPFANEHASSASPQFEFLASDIAGDDIDYQIQVSTDNTFGSTVIDRQSDVNPFDFENLTAPSDKAPFTSGQRIRFTPPSALTNGETYWWRVRAADPDGSDTFGDWSNAQSFTVNTGVTVTEWYQTTDEQFETGTLDSAQTSGSDSVELDIAGSNLIGEYGSLTVSVGATTTINLDNSYSDPVVVTSVRYPRSVASGDQPITRVFNKGASSFDVLAYTFDFDSVGTTTIDYVVMEAGEFLLADGDDGIRVFATSTAVSTVAGASIPNDPGGPVITFPTSFSAAPTVLAAVTTNNDPQWVVPTVYDGVSRANAPTATQVGVYLNDSLASDGHGAAEDIDIIAFDPRTNGENNGVTFESLRTPNSVSDVPFTQSFASAFSSTPGVIVVQQQTINGPQGGYAMVDVDTPPTANDVTVAFEEGGTAGARAHTDEIVGVVAFGSGGSDLIRGSDAQITSTAIDFADVKVGNAWGEVRWNSTGDVSVRVQYQTGGGFQDIPESDLPGNDDGFTSSPINLLNLDTTVYDELRLVATLSGVDPELFDWTVSWGQRVETPTLGDPFDNEKVGTTTPVFDFVTTDPQGDDLEYELSISTNPTFIGASTTVNSTASASDFANLTTPSDTNPFNSGDQISYTVPAGSALTDGETYWWRVRAKDPNDGNAFSPWSNADSFTVDTSTLVSTWHQTTQAQFAEGLLDGTQASTSDSVVVPPDIGEYGTITLSNNEWQTITTDLTYDEMVVVASPEFDFNGTDNGRTARVRNKTSNSFELKVDDYTNAFAGTTDVDYLVMEAGDWSIEDGGSGTRVIAGTAPEVENVKAESYDNSKGEIISFSPSFSTAPGAILTVSSNNDPEWVGTVMDDGNDVSQEITADQMNVSLSRSRTSGIHGPEDVDYVVFAVATGTNAGIAFDAFNSPNDVTDSETAVSFNQTNFSTAPAVTLVQINGMDGAQGGFAQKDTGGTNDAGTISLSVSEQGDSADGHTNETASVLAFEAASGRIVREDSIGGGLSGTIRSEPIDFFDGNGPRFEQFYWSDTAPGTSQVRLQVEYFDGDNWNLVPDDDWYDTDWTRRVPITLQSSQIEEDLTDFPVYVDLADLGAIFWNNVQTTGADIRVTESDGQTELPVDVTYIDTGDTEGEMHFKADLASSTDQTFYVYFGNAGASAYASSSDVWSNNYDARYQLGEDPTASAPQFTDSTGNGYTATARSGMSAADVVDGQVGQAIDLDGNDGATFDTDFAYPGPFTASMWWNSSDDGFAISRDSGLTEKFGPWTSGSLFARVVADTDDTTLLSPADGSWHYVVLQRDENDKVDVYIDGTQTRMFGDVAQTGVSDWENFGGQMSQGFVGQLDELRFATGTRTLGWLDTEYNNQSNPGAFYLVGSAQQTSGDTLIGNNAGFTGGGPVDLSGLDVGVYDTLRLLATLECGGSDCPTLDDWSVEWGEGVQLSGTLRENDRTTNVTSGTVRVAVNGSLQGGTGSVSNGSWSIGNVTAFSGDVITVYVEGATDAKRAATSFVYNGAGNMTGVEMYEGHLTLAGDNSLPLTNALLDSYDNGAAGGDTDVFFNVTGAGDLVVCAVANCNDFSLYITDDIDYRPSDTSAGDLTIGGDFRNEGTFTLDGNTMRVGGNWNNQATSSLGTGAVIFTALTGSYTITDHTNQLTFPQVTFGEGSGTATWALQHPFTVDTDLAIEYGTMDRFAAPTITVNGDITIGAAGAVSGGGTTNFAGSGVSTWSDDSAAGANLGNVVIDGSAKTILVTSDVHANDLTIGENDTLQGGSSNILHVGGDFTNNGTFTANTSTLELVNDVRGRQASGVQTAPWYDTDWSSRYPITIQASEIDDDLTDFPVTVDLADLPSAFWDEVRSDGGDIRVTTGDATTEVAREVSEFDAGSEAGELHFLAPTLSSTTDTTFYLYFGNAAEGDYATNATFGAEAVWSDYAGVWHFAEGSGIVANDSTSNGNDGTLQGAPTWTTGRLGTALEFDGNGDSGNRVQIPGFLNGTATTTVSVWFTQNAVESGNSNWTYVLHSSSDDTVGASDFWLGRLGNEDDETGDIGSAFGGWSNGLGHTGVALERDNRYYHVTAVQANGEVRLYVDGQLERVRPQSTFTFTGEDWGIGAAVNGNSGERSHPGIIDSPRVSTAARSAAWIAAEYRNGATTTDFYTVGAAEGAIGFTTSPASHEVTTGGANLHRLTMNDASTSASFVESTVTVQNDFTIATGTIALPTTLLSVGGNFANTGGVFMHNNSEVRFTGGGSKTIEQQGTEFLNAFYDVTFDGSGDWTYLDTNATTTNTYTISNGNVTFPSGSLTVGRDFVTSGNGIFDANEGEVVFLIEGPDEIASNGSEFHDVRIRQVATSSAGWLDNDWQQRLPIMVQATAAPEDLTDFPVYVDLSDMPAAFFSEVQSDGADIRITESDGVTEVPREVVDMSVASSTGELHFLAPSVSSSTDTTYYLYYGNDTANEPAASDVNGRNAVWRNGYVAVYHLPTTVDSTGNGYTLSESNITSASGLLGEAADFNGSNSVYTYGDPEAVLDGHDQFTLSAWIESDVSNTDQGFFRASAIDGTDEDIGVRYDRVGASAGADETIKGSIDTTDGAAPYELDAFVQTTEQQYFVQTWSAGSALEVYLDGASAVFSDSPPSRGGTTDVAAGTMYIGTGAKDSTSGGWDGRLDELRIASSSRSSGWIAAEYTNQSTTTDFYSVGLPQQSDSRAFTTANVTATGNVVIENGRAIFPSGTFSMEESFDNNGEFDANNGRVAFTTASGTHTVAPGVSSFAELFVDSTGGSLTITENATATDAIDLQSANDFTVDSGVTLETTGTFANALTSASTTWTGSTLRLAGGVDYVVNDKTNAGDTYDTVVVTDDGDISWWNSDATTYTLLDTASIYSQDHAGIDGDLHIFGDYVNEGGTEYWTYDTDFDGTSLGTTSARTANVRIADGSVVTASSATLRIVGDPSASTTIDAQSGDFSLRTELATVTAQYFTMTGTDVDGWQLLGSTTVDTLRDGQFLIGASEDAMSVDATTVNTNPAAQFFNLAFESLGGSNVNVDSLGSPTTFWWFREGLGDRYGEAFDDNDGNPGEIQWDDSNFEVAVSGTVYSDDGATIMGSSVCDGSTANVRIVVDGGAYASSTSCDSSGAYNFPAVSYNGDPTIVVYLDTNGGTNGSVITRTPTADITDLDIYANRVMTRHENLAPMTIERLASYDEADDSDLRFVAATGTPDTLVVRPDTELMVASGTTFEPGGNITLQSGGSGNGYDGSLHLDENASFIATGNETHLIGGSFFNDLGSSFTAASSTLEFTATTTGQGITNDNAGTLDFYELTFTGVGGGWNLTADITVAADMTVSTGTVSGTGDITLANGTLGGDGLLSMGGGVVTIENSTTLGGSQGWTFFDLELGDGATTSTTTRSATATTTVLGTLTINPAHFLDAGASQWDLAGSSTVMVESGTFLEGTSTVTYSGGMGATVLPTTYYNLRVAALSGTPSFTAGAFGTQVANDLTVAGAVPTTFDLNTNDPFFEVLGDVTIGANGTLSASNDEPLRLAGSYTNNGTFTANGGEVRFTGDDAYTITAGESELADVTLIGVGAATVTESATSTGVFTIASTSDFTVQSGTTLAVGGQLNLSSTATDWTGSTLRLYGGGDYLLNAKNVSPTFNDLVIGATTEIRTWNLTANSITVDPTGSLYSQDHAGVDGSLYVYGDYTEDARDDHWSYTTDFDGADLATTSSERAVSVQFASGAAATWTGGSISVIGTSTASTSITNQGSGTYSMTIGGTAETEWAHATVRDIDSSGLTFTGTPNVVGLDNLDLLVETNSASAITVGGTAITASPARTFRDVTFNADTGVTGAVNVTATGTTLSGWRFEAHSGNLDGEADDVDPAGDPGYIIWDDSAAIISISGTVYEADGTTESSVCDDVTPNIVLAVAGSLAQAASSSCSSTDGSYTISGVSFSSNDQLTIYIDGETAQAVTVSQDPISSIADMDLYEDHVIVRHENTDPITIADLAVWDSSNDADIPMTANTGSPDTLTLPADTKLLIWNGKEFAPDGDITLSGGGAGGATDGSLEARSGATFTGAPGEAHSVGGDFEFASAAEFVANDAAVTLTTSDAGRSVTVNDDSFADLTFNGSGSWTITDPDTQVTGDLTITSGEVTLSSGTTTVGASFVNNDTFTANNGTLFLNAAAGSHTVTLGGSSAAAITFGGPASWTISDTSATATDTFRVATGTVTLPSGIFAVGGNFIVEDTVAANNGTVVLTEATDPVTLTLNTNDLSSLILSGGATTTMTDGSVALQGDLTLVNGNLVAASNTLSVAGSLDATGGYLDTATGTILFNSDDTGEVVDMGSNVFYNATFANETGGWTLQSATTTNNFTLSDAQSFTLPSGERLRVGGVFQNLVGGAATTWTGSTLVLDGANAYTVNTKTIGGDSYGTVEITTDSEIRWWNSAADTLTVADTSSLYSQDHAASDGQLNIYGDFSIGTTTEYWSYATDFDGAALTGGTQRAVSVYHATSATTTVSGTGALEMIGAPGATTTVEALGTETYTVAVTGGEITFEYYDFSDLTSDGLTFSGTPTINSVSYGVFTLGIDSGTLITLARSTLNANPSLTSFGNGFLAGPGVVDGTNVALSASSSNAWRFRDHYGTFAGESNDDEGGVPEDCGSIRWDDSSCLLTEQTSYRWRNDDGGIGAPDGSWYDDSFTRRQRVRVANNDNTTYSDAVVRATVAYDADMQSNFDDLRFTADDGVTPIDFYLERKTNGVSADVWLEVPTLPADGTAQLFMYYGSSTAVSVSSSTATFAVADDFEDNNIAEYSGLTSDFQTGATRSYGGTYSLEADVANSFSDGGMARFDQTISQGQTIRYQQYIDTSSGNSDEICTLFGVQDPITLEQNYGLCFELFGTDRISLVKDAVRNDTRAPVSVIASSTVNFGAAGSGWYEVEIDWGTDDSFGVTVNQPNGSLLTTISDSDSDYTSGGYGFTYWTNHGQWDAFHARPTLATEPSIFFGAEQQDGGATFAAAENTPTSAFTFGDVARLRVAIENTGLDITGQQFRIEYAAKGAAPSCAAVDAADYAAVQSAGSCGSDAICMATSTAVSNGAQTTDLLAVNRNTFTPGAFVEDPTNQTSGIAVDQNEYTELEYALTVTSNAADESYCFRVTDAGTSYDSYTNIPELSLRFDPVVSAITLNNGDDISLIPGTTTAVFATGTVTDLNGVADLFQATSTIYRSGVTNGALCTEDNNNCYRSSTPQCEFTNCGTTSCTVECRADIFFHADPTDLGSSNEGEEWLAFVEVVDQNGGYDFNDSPGVELNTLPAIDVEGAIDYGPLTVNQDTGGSNASTSVLNLGNVAVDVEIIGSDLTDGVSSEIPASQQRYATSTFTYSSCGTSCLVLSTSSAPAIDLDLSKPSAPTPPVTDEVFWGISVPLGTNSAPHQGTNTFTPIVE